MRKALLLVSHLLTAAVGFAAGIYTLPILTAPPSPENAVVEALAPDARFSARFTRDLAGSDFLHWGEGNVIITEQHVALLGELAPGPAYKLYFSPVFVDDEASFLANKASMRVAGSIDTFSNFQVAIPEGLNPADFTTVVVWCDSFNEFITAARYQ